MQSGMNFVAAHAVYILRWMLRNKCRRVQLISHFLSMEIQLVIRRNDKRQLVDKFCDSMYKFEANRKYFYALK